MWRRETSSKSRAILDSACAESAGRPWRTRSRATSGLAQVTHLTVVFTIIALQVGVGIVLEVITTVIRGSVAIVERVAHRFGRTRLAEQRGVEEVVGVAFMFGAESGPPALLKCEGGSG